MAGDYARVMQDSEWAAACQTMRGRCLWRVKVARPQAPRIYTSDVWVMGEPRARPSHKCQFLAARTVAKVLAEVLELLIRQSTSFLWWNQTKPVTDCAAS
jgi:hypothetical protein